MSREFGIYDAVFGWVDREARRLLDEDPSKDPPMAGLVGEWSRQHKVQLLAKRLRVLSQGPNHGRTMAELLQGNPMIRVSEIRENGLVFVYEPPRKD